MSHIVRSERTSRLPACPVIFLFDQQHAHIYVMESLILIFVDGSGNFMYV